MDTRTAEEIESDRVQACVQLIKSQMPQTYRAIQSKAGEIGNDAFKFVRLGIKGQANSFYAVERGHVVGTPFDMPDVQDDMARLVLQFGCTFLLMWSPAAVVKGAADGAH